MRDFFDIIKPLTVPVGGKEYTLPFVSAVDGIRASAALDPKRPADVEPLSNKEFLEIFLGDTYQEMLDDGVPAQVVTLAAYTALADFQNGRATAVTYWEVGGSPKALTDLTEKIQEATASTQSLNTGEETTTKPRASTSGTKTSRKK